MQLFLNYKVKASKLFTWFNNNRMKANPEKNHLLSSSKTPEKACFGEALVESSSAEKMLGIQIDSDLTFDEHISSSAAFLIICLLKRAVW